MTTVGWRQLRALEQWHQEGCDARNKKCFHGENMLESGYLKGGGVNTKGQLGLQLAPHVPTTTFTTAPGPTAQCLIDTWGKAAGAYSRQFAFIAPM
jgi:hypothetical protein